MIRRRSRFDPFTDLLFNILLAFTFLFFITILFINPITKFGNINMKAEYIITVDWKDSLPDDIDLWVKDPNGEIVSYLKKDAGWLHLDRDDQGIINDKVTIDGKEVKTTVAKSYLNGYVEMMAVRTKRNNVILYTSL